MPIEVRAQKLRKLVTVIKDTISPYGEGCGIEFHALINAVIANWRTELEQQGWDMEWFGESP